MTRLFIALSLSFFLLPATLLHAQPLPSVQDVTTRMQARYEMIDDVRAEFTQTVVLG